jgi:hypothetical protein
MKNVSKLVLKRGLLSLLSVMPLTAQIDNGADFYNLFSVLRRQRKVTSGSYKITQSGIDTNMLEIQSVDHVHSAFLDIIPTQSTEPHAQSDVTFHKIRRHGVPRPSEISRTSTAAVDE